jgi:parallel beta-helix repeat protein
MRGLATAANLMGVAGAFLALGAVPAWADPPPILPTAVNALVGDAAVTDSQLATAGVVADGGTIYHDDPNLLLVDDDNVQCPSAPYHSIDEAVLAAPANATIRVCPGTYDQVVTVTKPLLIQAIRVRGQACGCHVSNVHDPTVEAITGTFLIEAPNVTIDGFTVVASSIGPDVLGFEVDFPRATITHNVVDGHDAPTSTAVNIGFGATEHTVVDRNCIQRVNVGVNDAGNGGQTITNNSIQLSSLNPGVGINLNPFGATVATPATSNVSHNAIVGAGLGDTGINVVDNGSATISYNTVTGSDNGIVVRSTESTGSVRITYNVVRCGAENGIQLSFGFGLAANDVVQGNSVSGFGMNGIDLGPFTSGSTIASNRVTGSGFAGIHAEATTSENTIQGNSMSGNHPDCQDDTVGTHSAGTANFWICNLGFTENRPGLCTRNH